jgi:hypothetical protein
MTTPQLPPLPEPTVKEWYGPNSDLNEEWLYDSDQMQAYALAALSTRPVAESIHEANAKTLQALVDELREMLGVKEGESLKEAVQRAINDGNRYQWWATTMFWRPSDVARVIGPCESADQLDAAIDAAMNDAAPIKKEQEA